LYTNHKQFNTTFLKELTSCYQLHNQIHNNSCGFCVTTLQDHRTDIKFDPFNGFITITKFVKITKLKFQTLRRIISALNSDGMRFVLGSVDRQVLYVLLLGNQLHNIKIKT
jgi:hypothetical protein